MLRKTECLIPVCDICGKDVEPEDAEVNRHFETEAEAMEMALQGDEYGGADCQMIDNKLCCSRCWWYDDDDEIALRPVNDSDDACKP